MLNWVILITKLVKTGQSAHDSWAAVICHQKSETNNSGSIATVYSAPKISLLMLFACFHNAYFYDRYIFIVDNIIWKSFWFKQNKK